MTNPVLERQIHQPLPEQFIWFSKDAGQRPTTPLYFRSSFVVANKPAQATLYVAGPDQVSVYLNGKMVGNFNQNPATRTRPAVFVLNVGRSLAPGKNVLALMTSVETASRSRLSPGHAMKWSPRR